MLEIKKINPLNPFGRMCVSLGMLPSSYKESMTYEEQLLWLFNYLDKTLIPKLNEQDETINEVIDLFNQLKEYVDTYFDNLDVQDEINNKLDEMVEDGTFDVIFAQVDAKIGDLSSLTTTDTSSIVGAVNEIDSHTDDNTSAIGTLSDLTTTAKSNLVSAINEVNSKHNTSVVTVPIVFEQYDVFQSGKAHFPTGYTRQNCFVAGVYYVSNTTNDDVYVNDTNKLEYFVDNYGCDVTLTLPSAVTQQETHVVKVIFELL